MHPSERLVPEYNPSDDFAGAVKIYRQEGGGTFHAELAFSWPKGHPVEKCGKS